MKCANSIRWLGVGQDRTEGAIQGNVAVKLLINAMQNRCDALHPRRTRARQQMFSQRTAYRAECACKPDMFLAMGAVLWTCRFRATAITTFRLHALWRNYQRLGHNHDTFRFTLGKYDWKPDVQSSIVTSQTQRWKTKKASNFGSPDDEGASLRVIASTKTAQAQAENFVASKIGPVMAWLVLRPRRARVCET